MTSYDPVLPGFYPAAPTPSPMREELDRRATNTDAVRSFFTAHPGEWISALDLERVGGRQAWRTRVSDCRTQYGMTIENRQRNMRTPDGYVRVSEYRYVP